MGVNEDKKDEVKKNLTAGATALVSVLAVPLTLLAGFLISSKRKK